MAKIIHFLVLLTFFQIAYASSSCVNTVLNYTQGSVYENNLHRLLVNLSSKSSSLKFYNSTLGVGSNQVYGLFQCRDDVGLDQCNTCVEDATRMIIEECPLFGEAIVWYDECMLRYASRDIFSVSETSPWVRRWSTEDISNSTEFGPMLESSLIVLIKNASSSSPHFASSKTNWTSKQPLYSFAQCTPDIDTFGCYTCLDTALSNIIDCCSDNQAAIFFMPSCQLWFNTTGRFLNDQPSIMAPPPAPAPILSLPRSPPHSTPIDNTSVTTKNTALEPKIIIAITVCASVGLLVISTVLAICLCRKRVRSDVAPTSRRGLLDGTTKSDEESLGDTEFVQFDFNTLKLATRNFSIENKLGEGGFGAVYMGALDNGVQLAIKRLSANSGQGTKEFMTEARLLAKLQHRNLVKLMGFCTEGDEKLLVYEFMSNASLDGFLFDPSLRKRHLLDWVIRYRIIMGIARGLQYLHEDSRLTIIHRDLKPGNILLDNEMNPKIADFGLAKLCGGAQKFGNTSRIAGTPGYMAPEYMTTGEFSDKSDVYSFGIMLLEILSGENNIKYYYSQKKESQRKEDLPAYAWRLWNEERSPEFGDPVLSSDCSGNNMTRCIQIGLLCLQANADDRPTMALVVFMLTGSVDLPVPQAPAMSFPQFNTPLSYSSLLQSDVDLSSTKSVTQELPLNPR
ncbi:hypothetical protein vseg_017408 [Gypsophila vaccaria]